MGIQGIFSVYLHCERKKCAGNMEASLYTSCFMYNCKNSISLKVEWDLMYHTFLGFAIIFSIMDPVPRIAKLLFHVFGFGSFILGLISSLFTFQAAPCVSTIMYV